AQAEWHLSLVARDAEQEPRILLDRLARHHTGLLGGQLRPPALAEGELVEQHVGHRGVGAAESRSQSCAWPAAQHQDREEQTDPQRDRRAVERGHGAATILNELSARAARASGQPRSRISAMKWQVLPSQKPWVLNPPSTGAFTATFPKQSELKVYVVS